MVWSWFGGAAAQKRKDAPKEAILALREHLEMLQKREAHLTTLMEEQENVAKKNISTNKNAAKAALRRKKVHEKNLEQTTAQVAQMEQQIYSIETANINQKTLEAIKSANTAMSHIHGSLTIDKVDETMDQLRDQHQLSEEIASVIANNPLGEQPDESELDAELEGLEQEAMDERMLKTGTVPVSDQLNRLPAAGTGELKNKPQKAEEEDEEAELEKLRAEMAM